MPRPSHLNLKAIHFEGQLLPNWAQLLDLASRICTVSDEARHWFSTFTNANGVDDARSVLAHCEALRSELLTRRDYVQSELRREQGDGQVSQIYGAWIYALETMIQQASGSRTCTWVIEGMHGDGGDDSGDSGEIDLRRV